MDIPQLDQLGSFEGRTCLITGGSSGIGLTLALELHSLGANIIVLDLNPPHPSLQKSVPTDSRFAYAQCDVASYASQLAAFKYCEQKYGRFPDVVYANAGIGEQFKPLIPVELHNVDEDQEMELEPKHEVIEIDLKAVANTVRLAWLGMRKELKAGRLEKGGSIILTASMAGHCGQPGLVLYNAAKHGVVGLARSLRYLAPSHKIAISHVAPTITNTPILTTTGSTPLQPQPTTTPSAVGVGVASPTPNELAQLAADAFEHAGVPVNTPSAVSRVMIELAQLGPKANGLGVLVQGDRKWDLENGLLKSRPNWMGETMAKWYRSGKGSEAKIGGEAAKKPKNESKL